ncbi:MAG: hypothetical protein PHY91_10180 [Tissierellia bacterium]|nr:hypothetical protein [Tissierellia bacterium]
MRRNSGISLIVLVITIIVILILAGAVILSLVNNNPINQASEGRFKSNIDAYNSELNLAISQKYFDNHSFNPNTFDKPSWNGIGDGKDTIKEFIPSITKEDAVKFEIVDSKLTYIGEDLVEINWLTDIGISVQLVEEVQSGMFATKTTTSNGRPATYYNPIVPKGFRVVNTEDASWDNISTDWNKGLVIEDDFGYADGKTGNQYVWVPVDGTNVKYEKNFTYPSDYGATNVNTIDDVFLSGTVKEQTQIDKYGGFYIARYEAGYYSDPINGSRITSRKGDEVCLYVPYEDAKIFTQGMYNTEEVKSGLVTGTQWDTVLKWIGNSGISVTDSTSWGNHFNSPEPGAGEEHSAGFSEKWKANNIYDLAGDVLEWTTELHGDYCVVRGGDRYNSGSDVPVSYRQLQDPWLSEFWQGFRSVLYIK